MLIHHLTKISIRSTAILCLDAKSIRMPKVSGDGDVLPKMAILKLTPTAVLKTRKNVKKMERKTGIVQAIQEAILTNLP